MLKTDLIRIKLNYIEKFYNYCYNQVQDIVFQLHRFITSMSKYHTECYDQMKSIVNIFPIEVDLPANITFHAADSVASESNEGGEVTSYTVTKDSDSDSELNYHDAMSNAYDMGKSNDANLIDISNNDH